ncbi:MAG: HNH endonuclease [Planctomycetes bacterium]|nr:HNH endonuclease [Planctomycetota bacterium]
MNRKTSKQDWIARFAKCAKDARQPHAETVGKKIVDRCGAMISTLRTRCKDSGQECLLSLDDMRAKMEAAYGKPCRYCLDPMKHTKTNSLSPDHIVPMADGGETTEENIELICTKCNRRKDTIAPERFQRLMDEVNRWPLRDRSSVLARLSVGGMHFKRGTVAAKAKGAA